MSNQDDSDLSDSEREEREEEQERQRFENQLPEDPQSYYSRSDFAERLIPLGYKPLGPYSEGNFFIMRQRGTGKRYYFQTPRTKDNRPDTSFVDRLKDLYNEKYPDPSYVRKTPIDQQQVNPVEQATGEKRDEMRESMHDARMQDKQGLMSNDNLPFHIKDSTKPVIKTAIEKAAWYENAIMEIGQMTIFALVQFYKLNPNENIYDWLKKLHEKGGLEDWFRNTLSTLLTVARNPQEAAELRHTFCFDTASDLPLKIELFKVLLGQRRLLLYA
jgi:hypothetical protein